MERLNSFCHGMTTGIAGVLMGVGVDDARDKSQVRIGVVSASGPTPGLSCYVGPLASASLSGSVGCGRRCARCAAAPGVPELEPGLESGSVAGTVTRGLFMSGQLPSNHHSSCAHFRACKADQTLLLHRHRRGLSLSNPRPKGFPMQLSRSIIPGISSVTCELLLLYYHLQHDPDHPGGCSN
jgi:hypothetical protein